MTQWGGVHCLASSRGTFDERLVATYYDAIRVFEQIREYTGNPTQWEPCIAAAVTTYRGYVESSVTYEKDGYGALQGYWNFTGGLRKHYERTGDQQSRTAVLELAKHAAYCADWTPLDYIANPARSREVAYCINARVDAQALGLAVTPYTDQVKSAALGHLDQWFVSKTWRMPAGSDVPEATGQYYLQPFMVFLTAEALLKLDKDYPDGRILPAVKNALEQIHVLAWVSANQAFWYDNWTPDPSQPFPSKPGAPDLNLLGAAAYYKVYVRTGDVRFRDWSDEIFAGGVLGAWLEGPKQFNQNYMLSFDYVKARK